MKEQIFKMALVVALAISLVSPVIAQTYNGQPLQGGVTYVPVGTTIDTILTSPIDSALAKPGDVFNAKLLAPLYLGSDLVLPANSILEGMVASAEKGGHMGVNGTTQLRLTAAVTPDGIRYPLSAVVSANQSGINQTKDGTLKGRSTKASVGTGAARIAAWTAGGTLLGIIFAPIVAGSVGIGAIAGVATGAGVGVGSDLWRKGKEVAIPSGTKLAFQLDQPMSLTTGIASAPHR
jgi:hypothetical protein